ncbi:MAG: fibrinogen-binding protein, partial [Pirellulales bacterium]
APGENLVDYDFCEIPAASISGFVFQDGPAIAAFEISADGIAEVRDGQFTSDDRPLSGVTLELRDGTTGRPVSAEQTLPGRYNGVPIHVRTDGNGFYEFTGLAPGFYAVFEVHPSSFIDGIDTPGSLGGTAVNRHEAISRSILSDLEVDPAYDAILGIPLGVGQRATDNNFSEVLIESNFWIPADPPPVASIPFLPPPSTMFLPPRLFDRVYIEDDVVDVFGGSSSAPGYTWHLSVIDGGTPRSIHTNDKLVQLTSSHFDVVAWRQIDMRRSSWTFKQIDIDESEGRQSAVFGTPHAHPITGDFNGDGVTEQGVFLKGQWFIDLNGNGKWDVGDLWARLGHDGDLPITGDWDGDGKADIGIFGPAWPGDPMAVKKEPGLPDPSNVRAGRPKNIPPLPSHAAVGSRTLKLTSLGKPRADLIDHVFHYGTAGDLPITGDWNGDGIDTIGVFRGGHWHLDVDGDGRWTEADGVIELGQAGDLPVVGDWDGDGIDELGIYRNGTWMIDTNGDHQFDARDKVFEMGASGDTPVVGDWNGDGIDQPGIYHGDDTAARPAA